MGALTVACPACHRKLDYSVFNTWRLFFSERCRRHDLDAGASEIISHADIAKRR